MKCSSCPWFPLWLIGLTLLLYAEPTVNGQISVIGSQPMASASSGGGSYLPQFSHDGQRILFLSYANNLVTNDDRGFWLDAFVRDLNSLTSHLMSAGSTDRSGANENVTSAIISPDGQWVVFTSAATNLLATDTSGTNAAFLRHIPSGLTSPLLTKLSSTAVPNLPSCFQPSSKPVLAYPAFSADGQMLVFESHATNLVENDTNLLSDIFTLNLTNSEISLVSTEAFADPCVIRPPSRSYAPAINADGSRVAFVSTAILPAATVHNPLGDVYVRDVNAATTCWASRDVSQLLGQSNFIASFNPAISADGRKVIFLSSVGGSSNATLIHHDLDTSASVIVSSNTPAVSFPTLSTNGQVVTYIEGAQIYQWCPTNSAKTLVSFNRDGTAGGGGRSHSQAVTPDGQFIAFLSDAPDLVAGSFDRTFRIYRRDVTAGTTQLVTPPGQTADEANQPVISDDGRRIAFESKAPLVAGDRNRAQDVFVFDAVTGGIELVSRTSSGLDSDTAPMHVRVSHNSMSADGRFVAYEGPDNDWVLSDTDGLNDVFIYDRVVGTNIFVGGRTFTRPTPAFEPPIQVETGVPRLSSNGRYVVFAETPRLGDVKFLTRIVRRDLLTGDELQIAQSVDLLPDYLLSLSADGNRVLFGTTNGQALVKHFTGGVSHVITNISATSKYTVLSPDGRWVFNGPTNPTIFDLELGVGFTVGYNDRGVFSADSRTLILQGRLSRVDLLTRTTEILSSEPSVVVRRASVSADGLVVVFGIYWGMLDRTIIIDLREGTTNYLTTTSDSAQPVITYDGRYVAFLSTAATLVPHDNNNAADLFVYDRASGQTISITGPGGIGSPLSRRASTPILGGDGRSILFMSLDPDLIPNDFNGRRDIFVVQLGSDDSDHDGLDDDWEWAYFSTLARDGSGDFDSDGTPDAAEFRAGTDPTNERSVFRVMTISRVGTDELHLVWQSVPGKSYRVQYRDMTGDAGWVNAVGIVTAQGFSASTREFRSLANRFYRVSLSE